MLLVGRYLSPFVRRCGISFHLMRLPFGRKILSTIDNRDEVRKLNPLGRIPALIIGQGTKAESLIDSTAILDYADETAGPRRRLTPVGGAARRRVNKIVFTAVGTMDLAVQTFYETARRPADKVHAPRLEHLEGQVAAGLDALNAIKPAPWLAGKKLTQADVTTAVLVEFVGRNLPRLLPAGRYRRLEALAKKCAKLPAFKACAPEVPKA
jgi:glutathione S-transferase